MTSAKKQSVTGKTPAQLREGEHDGFLGTCRKGMGLIAKAAILLAAIGWGVRTDAGSIVSGTRFQQRYPWNGLVDIDFTITCGNQAQVDLSVTATDLTTGKALATDHLWVLNGTNRISNLRVGLGQHRLLWDAGTDVPGFASTNVSIAVRATAAQLRYMVIDLSNSGAYPVSYLADVPAGGWTDEYKTTKLVLRRIEPGRFLMGSSGELGAGGNEDRHPVALKKPYYMGVFEVTQRQWELVMGTRPSFFNNATYYATRPVEQVSYNMIRGTSLGAKWPSSSEVDASSFIGLIRQRTGDAAFDLPTEAQWENACRAGTTTALNNGCNLSNTTSDANLNEVARYYVSSGQEITKGTATVGSYKPNAWGLYDMHGNVYEWCLDWYTASLGVQQATDPVGASSGGYRVLRGGDWYNSAQYCRSARRYCDGPSNFSNYYGFRLCR